jgi:uncharacterized phiE125 gp8 family phage protein
MKYGMEIVTPPAAEPVLVDDTLKAHLRVSGTLSTEENALLEAYVGVAREYFEDRTSRQLITCTRRVWYERFPGRFTEDNPRPPSWRFGVIRLPIAPVTAITAITYVDTDRVTQTLATSEYQYTVRKTPALVAPAPFKPWPVTDPLTLDAVSVTFTCGFGASGEPRVHRGGLLERDSARAQDVD